jgi:hypothetical protein
VSDFISGIKYLERQGMIDRNKVGIYGPRYGFNFDGVPSPEYLNAVSLRAVRTGKLFFSSWWYTRVALIITMNPEVLPYLLANAPPKPAGYI